jgi:hypothetical protein
VSYVLTKAEFNDLVTAEANTITQRTCYIPNHVHILGMEVRTSLWGRWMGYRRYLKDRRP